MEIKLTNHKNMSDKNSFEKSIDNIEESLNRYYQQNGTVRIEITEQWIQAEAEQELERLLSQKELQEVENRLYDSLSLSMCIRDVIREVIDWNDLMGRNKDAEKFFPHFKLFRLCRRTGEKDFKLEHIFLHREDIEEYKRGVIRWVGDEWKTVRVDEGGIETVIEMRTEKSFLEEKTQSAEGIPPASQQGDSKTTTCRLCFPQNQDNEDKATPLD